MKKPIYLILTLALLTGCATIISEDTIPLRDYSSEEQQEAADSYERLPTTSILRDFIDDYGDLRQLVRCHNDRASCEAPLNQTGDR